MSADISRGLPGAKSPHVEAPTWTYWSPGHGVTGSGWDENTPGSAGPWLSHGARRGPRAWTCRAPTAALQSDVRAEFVHLFLVAREPRLPMEIATPPPPFSRQELPSWEGQIHRGCLCFHPRGKMCSFGVGGGQAGGGVGGRSAEPYRPS